MRMLAQTLSGTGSMARALALGARGSGFESRVPDQKLLLKKSNFLLLKICYILLLCQNRLSK
jgi:hypothetical protein